MGMSEQDFWMTELNTLALTTCIRGSVLNFLLLCLDLFCQPEAHLKLILMVP